MKIGVEGARLLIEGRERKHLRGRHEADSN
jgi:hypothetical protein